MRGYSEDSATAGFSIFSSFLFMIAMFIVPIYFSVKIYKLLKNHPTTCKMINKGYEYIVKQ